MSAAGESGAVAGAAHDVAEALASGELLPLALLRGARFDAGGSTPFLAGAVLASPEAAGTGDDPDPEGLAELAGWLRGIAAHLDALAAEG